MQPVNIRLPSDLIEAIDKIIEDRVGQSDRPTVVRELIARGLKDLR